MDLKKAGPLKPQVEQMMFTGQEFVRNHEESLVMIRAVTKQLFDLAEQLATKEINNDPKGFIMRESINRMSLRKPLKQDLLVYSSENELLQKSPQNMGKPNTKEESKSNSTSGELGMAFNEDEDDDVF